MLTALCMAPLVIPGIVLAIGFYAAWSPPPLALYGTAAILVLGYTTRFLPIAYVNCMAGLRSLNPEMEDAVRILGGSQMRALARVVVPLLKKSLVGIMAAGVHPGNARTQHGDIPGRPRTRA